MTEAAIRTAHFLLTGHTPDQLKVQALRGLDGIKEFRTTVAGREIGVAAVSGLGNARKLLEQIRAGRTDLHFIEVMTCPGGCMAGGGQPRSASPDAVRARMQALYVIDREPPCARRTRTRPSSGSTPSSWRSRWRTRATNCCTRATKAVSR